MVELEALLRRDRVIVVAGLLATAALAWIYLVHLAGVMPGMTMDDMPGMAMRHVWTGADLLLLFVMWAVMMIAMMVPAATPMILTFARVQRQRREAARPAVPTALFLLGYAAVWTAYAALAAVAQWRLHALTLLSPAMASGSVWLGGGLLVTAGVFQWTPLKQACLAKCRSPLSFLMTEWREGRAGAIVMGARHGAYCVGCCWALMALLFVAGVMNLLWIAALAAFVLVERTAPAGRVVGRVAGALLVVAGLVVLLRA